MVEGCQTARIIGVSLSKCPLVGRDIAALQGSQHAVDLRPMLGISRLF